MRRGKINRAVFEIDNDPVERLRHDLHGLDAGDGGDRTEGGAAFAPLVAQAIERWLHRWSSGWNTPAKKRHQLLAQAVRAARGEDHLGARLVGLPARAEQVGD